jgi:hypothetical protein
MVTTFDKNDNAQVANALNRETAQSLLPKISAKHELNSHENRLRLQNADDFWKRKEQSAQVLEEMRRQAHADMIANNLHINKQKQKQNKNYKNKKQNKNTLKFALCENTLSTISLSPPKMVMQMIKDETANVIDAIPQKVIKLMPLFGAVEDPEREQPPIVRHRGSLHNYITQANLTQSQMHRPREDERDHLRQLHAHRNILRLQNYCGFLFIQDAN